MSDFRIRPATLEDLPVIVHHRRRMFADMGKGTPEVLDAMGITTAAYLHRSIPDGWYRGWLAEAPNGRIVSGAGVALAPWPGSPEDPSPRRGIIINVYTEPDFRRRGLAEQLMTNVIEWCRAEGFHTVSLHASAYGRPLYEKLGFAPTNEMRLHLV